MISDKFYDFINLHQGEEQKEKVLENIRANISFRGSNLWVLACAIVIASVGLNVNSTAVIIGAMLISPLMGPIVGAGFALAMYDFELLKKSGKNLLIATVVSLVVSTIYFTLSPFKETQSEILARTAPNIYDVLIAFFGGLVGVIALTRVEKGNPIPGVAIATALMPPLCTAGYGVAIGKTSYFLGAFYLYSINSFFICIATFFIVKYLNYPSVTTLNPKYEKHIRYGITTLIFIMIIPSFYLAYNLFQEKKFSEKTSLFIENEFTKIGHIVIYKDISYNTNPKKIDLALLNKDLSHQEIQILNKKLSLYNIQNTKLNIRQDSIDLKGEILSEIGIQNKNISEKDIIIKNLQNELDKYKFENPEAISEMNILFPELKDIAIGKVILNPNTDSTKPLTVLFYRHDKDVHSIDTEKIKKWLSLRLDTPDILLINK